MEGFKVTVVHADNPDSTIELFCDGWFGTAGMVTDFLPRLTENAEPGTKAAKIEITYGEMS